MFAAAAAADDVQLQESALSARDQLVDRRAGRHSNGGVVPARTLGRRGTRQIAQPTAALKTRRAAHRRQSGGDGAVATRSWLGATATGDDDDEGVAARELVPLSRAGLVVSRSAGGIVEGVSRAQRRSSSVRRRRRRRLALLQELFDRLLETFDGRHRSDELGRHRRLDVGGGAKQTVRRRQFDVVLPVCRAVVFEREPLQLPLVPVGSAVEPRLAFGQQLHSNDLLQYGCCVGAPVVGASLLFSPLLSRPVDDVGDRT